MKRSKKTKGRDARDLSAFINDRGELTRRMFRALKPSEIKAMAPSFAKTLPLDDLQALCLEELINMSAKSLRTILCTPTQDNTITLDSDSETESSASSDTDTSDSESDDSDSTDGSSAVSDDVMVVEDSDEDVKVEIDSKPNHITTNGAKTADKENLTNRIVNVSSNRNNRSDVVKDQYADKINKLDILTAKLGQEIEKLSKKKESTSKELTNEHVNEMMSELTKIHSEISTEKQKDVRKNSTDTDVTEESASTRASIKESKKKNRKGEIGESNGKQSKCAKNNGKKRKHRTSSQKSEEAVLVQNEGTDKTVDRLSNNKVSKKPQTKDESTNSASSVSKPGNIRKVTTNESTENSKEATVCLLSDSEDSEEELEEELQKSITESRKNNINKETQKVQPQKVERIIDKRKKPFSEDDIEIEIVVGGDYINNTTTTAKNATNNRETNKNKGANSNKNTSKCASEKIVNEMIKQIDSNKTNQVAKNTQQITILSSDSEEPEEGEVNSSTDDSDGSKSAPKKRLKKAGVVRIKSKKANNVLANPNKERESSFETTQASVDKSEGVVNSSENETRLQIKSAIVKVNENDTLNETNLNKVKSVAVKVPHANDVIKIKVGDSNLTSRVVLNENRIKPRDSDNITVVVKNATDEETDETNRIVKMTEDYRSVESVVVAVRNVDSSKESSNKAAHHKDLRPAPLKFVAKASDFIFVKPKDHGKPKLIPLDVSTKENTAENTNPNPNKDMNEAHQLDSDYDMDVLEKEYTDIVVLEETTCAIESTDEVEKETTVTNSEPISDSHNVKSADLNTDDISVANEHINISIAENVEEDETKLLTDVVDYSSIKLKPHCDKAKLTKTIERLRKIESDSDSSPKQDTKTKDLLTETSVENVEHSSDSIIRPETVKQAYFEHATIHIKTHEMTESSNNVNITMKDLTESNFVKIRSNMECTYDSEETIFKEAIEKENEVEELRHDVERTNSSPQTTNVESQNLKSVTGEELTEEIDTFSKTDEESSTNDTHLETTSIPESNLTATENKDPKQNTLETINAIPMLYQEHSTSILSNKEDGELEPTTEQTALHKANHLLEDGEIDAAEELATNTAVASDAAEDGELTDPSSSDVESVEIPNEVICISDEEPAEEMDGTKSSTGKVKSKKKKKEKKRKKGEKKKKCKGKCKQRKRSEAKEEEIEWVVKESVVNEVNDVNDLQMVKSNDSDNNSTEEIKSTTVITEVGESINISAKEKEKVAKPLDANKEDIKEITSDSNDIQITDDAKTTKDSSQNVIDMLSIEISSDDSSDEPIIEDIDVITAAIDGIENQQLEEQKQEREIDENISWRDRYLDSKKVKQVLTTSNIFNALRKKNKELKKKLLEEKLKEKEREITPEPPAEEVVEKDIEEGSIEHYNTLEGSSKFVDPVPDPADIETEKEIQNKTVTSAEMEKETQNKTEVTSTEGTNPEAGKDQAVAQTSVQGPEGSVSREMKKDAKNLLKMYKKLLKYNDVTRASNPSKKAKKKKRKKDLTC